MTEKEFEMVKGVFEENNPRLASDPDAIRREMESLDKEMQRILSERPEEFAAAIHILWQGRNFLSLYIGEEEIPLPSEVQEAVEPQEIIDPLSSKHVAVYAGPDGPFSRATAQFFGLWDSVLRFQCYQDIKSLLADLIAGKVCGVIGFRLSPEASIESTIRHDLKYWPAFDYEKAEAFNLPPCVDFTHLEAATGMLKALEVAIQMQNGSYRPKESEDFSLAEEMPYLIQHMYALDRGCVVYIIDDQKEEMAGMVAILNAWPLIKCNAILQQDTTVPPIPMASVVLLDEDMPVKGSEIAKHIGRSTLVASTTSGERPSFTSWHFGNKGRIAKEKAVAKAFVSFMNELLSRLS